MNGSRTIRTFVIAALILGAAVMVVLAAPEASRFGASGPIRLVRDWDDASAYFARGEWAVDGTVPYRDYFAEYPPLAVLYVGLLRWKARSLFDLQVGLAITMALTVWATVTLLARALPRRRLAPERALLLLLPAGLYFALNRFDALVALTTLAAVLAALEQRYARSGVLLGIGTGLKLTPLLLLPLLVAWERNDPSGRRPQYGSQIIVGCVAVVSAAHLPLLFVAGWHVFSGYLFQLGRGVESGSLLSLFALRLGYKTVPTAVLRVLFPATILALAIAAGLLGFPDAEPERSETLLRRAGLALGAALLLSAFSSPQWLLWLTPLLVLADVRPPRAWLAVIATWDLLSYIQFPIAWDLGGPDARLFHWVTLARSVALVLLLLMLRVRPRLGFAPKINP
jgi:glycosyl transferase family 87